MSSTALLLVLLSLAPYEPRAQLERRAAAIAGLGAAVDEVAALVAIDFYETTLGRSGVAFGACAHLCATRCARCASEPLERTAAWALETWRNSRRQCGRDIRLRLGWYHSGACRRARFAAREADQARRLERAMRRMLAAPSC